MKVYDVAAVIDCGKYYEVEYLSTNMTSDFEKNSNFVGLNNIAAIKIAEALEDNKSVRIIKGYQNKDVMNSDVIVVQNNSDELASYKMILIQKARQRITHHQANVSGIQMYEFIMINNYLSDKGYFIHDDNREEQYLAILETGNEDLIDKLEIYLLAKDDIARASSLEKLYTKLYNDMNAASSTELADEVFSAFMSSLNAGSK